MTISEETNNFPDFDIYYDNDLISYTNTPTIPKWEYNTIHAAGELAGNPSDPRRTRSQFESTLSFKDPFFAHKCYIMVESYPKTYE